MIKEKKKTNIQNIRRNVKMDLNKIQNSKMEVKKKLAVKVY